MGELNETSLLSLAATGDRDAQAALRDRLLLELDSPTAPCLPVEIIAMAEVFARQAATHGHTVDQLSLAGTLLLRAAYCRLIGRDAFAAPHEAESCAMFDALMESDQRTAALNLVQTLSENADKGDEAAALIIERLIVLLPPSKAAAICAAIRPAVMAEPK